MLRPNAGLNASTPLELFEQSIDYVVTKIPRFAFEKFPQADPTLTTQMKSVGLEQRAYSGKPVPQIHQP